ncbi:MAG: 50S ribosomal protein L17 [Opitutaceae bacterium]|nr:50S ribosomal protein L17 [Opitutaceae bacterium]
MRHNKHHASLGVTREHRKAMLSNLGAALIRHGRIQTTLTKAKALRPWIEKVITKAKKAGAIPRIEKDGKQLLQPRALHLRRLAIADLRDEDMITKLFNETYKEFEKRPGGYTRIYKLGPRSYGDAASMALIELVKADDPGYPKRKRRPAKAAKAKGAKADASAKPDVDPAAEGEAKA